MSHLQNIDGAQMEGKLPVTRLSNQPFEVVSEFEPAGDQPEAIEQLAKNIEAGMRYQTLLGVTGSGKTYTVAKTIEAIQRPTLILAPNKTLAAQLAAELKEFFPNNAVVYFVSYYDYYQPEAYVPTTDTFIERMHPSMRRLRSCVMQHSRVTLAARCDRGRFGIVHLRYRFSC